MYKVSMYDMHACILCIGPKQHMLIDFWRLIWQERPPTIVMVTNLKEGNKKKCEQYWPENGNATFGPFKITLTEQQVFADYCIRTMQVSVSSEISHTSLGNHGYMCIQIQHSSTERPFKVKQYHYTSWPDHGVPEYAAPMLSFRKRIISHHKTSRGPILVHCR